MPATFSFFQNDEPIRLSVVDDIIREILEMDPDEDKFTREYDTLTWLVIGYNSYDEMLEKDHINKDDNMVKIIKGLQERNITYKNGYVPKCVLKKIDKL